MLTIIADGEPLSPQTNSGVPRHLLDALTETLGTRPATIDGTMPNSWRLRSLAASLRVAGPRGARAEYLFGRTGIDYRSRYRDTLIAERVPTPSHVLHVRNVYAPAPVSYSVFIDSTTRIAVDSWPAWADVIGNPAARIAAETRSFAGAVAVYTAGSAAARSVVDDYGCDPSKVVVVGAGSRFPPSGPRRRPEVDRPFRVVFVGTEFERKGGDIVMSACEDLRILGIDVELLLVGGDAPVPSRDWVHDLGRITNPAAVETIMRMADAFCLPARHEPFGLVVLEAMALGTPVVVSDAGVLPDIVGLAGTVVPKGATAGVSGGLRRLAEDCDWWQESSDLSRARVANSFTWSGVADKIINDLRDREVAFS